MKQIRYSAGNEGYCNVCGTFGRLTFDHVPPRSCVGIRKRRAALLTEAMDCGDLGWYKSRHFQDGLKFKSICNTCNSDVLGSRYDPHLKQFAGDISRVVDLAFNKGIALPGKVFISISLQRVVRSIIGHAMAAYVREDMTTPPRSAPYLDALRSYFLNESQPIPDQLEIYYWIYPSDIQVIILGCGLSCFGSKTTIVGDLLKFYPVAFWVVWSPPAVNVGVPSLIGKRNIGIDDFIEVPVSLWRPPRLDWPENPANDQFVLLNSEVAYIAKRKRKKQK
ncbi:MAG: hypothetical protein AB1461_04435 [Thermodesulfobacteriota bacterium]